MDAKPVKLSKSLKAFHTREFNAVLKSELQQIDKALLPLQQGLSLSSYVGNTPFSAVILNIHDRDNSILIKAGIFYTGIIAGCSCSDDPSPMDEQNEYCELQFKLNKKTAEALITLLTD